MKCRMLWKVIFQIESLRIINLKMKKIVLLITCFLLLGFSAFAYEGPMSGQKNLRIVKTEHFDIIYAPASADSAKILLENGENLYGQIAEQFELKQEFRLPVVITPASDDLNGYFSSFPFNHIVLYDSLPYDRMTVFSETFINTFKHELIHAITYNLRSEKLYKLNKVLGDIYSPVMLSITTFFAEGATVSLESENGEGRMNSEYSKQILKQAKIEGTFPDLEDAQGAMDIYPNGNVSYIFGGAFCKWLEVLYGQEKYSDFWYRCVNGKNILYSSAFNAVYGFSIKKAWKDFYDSIEIPEGVVIKKPKRREISRYESLTSSDIGTAYFDLNKTAVYLKRNDKKRAKLLLTQSNLTKVNFSKDGKYLAVSYSDASYPADKNRVYVYDLKKRRSFYIPEAGLRDAAILERDGKYYLAAVKTDSEYSTLKIYRLLRKKNNSIAKAKLVSEQPLNYGSQHLYLEGDGQGNLYYVYKKGLNFSICKYSLESKQTSRFALPEGKVEIQRLSYSDGKIYFSYTFPGTLPRLGILEQEENSWKFNLSSDEISGGILSPVCSGENIEYIASYYNGRALRSLQKAEFNFDEYEANEEVCDSLEDKEGIVKANPEEIEGSKKFNPVGYTFKGPHGTFVPFSFSSSHAIDSGADTLVTDSDKQAMLALPIGITYLSSLPWTYPVYYLSAGYGIFTNSFGLSAGIHTGKTDSNLFNYSAAVHFEFDENGFKQNYDTISLSVKLPMIRTLFASVSNVAEFFEGRQSKTEYYSDDVNNLFDYVGILSEQKKNEDLSIRRIFAKNNTSVAISNYHKAGKGYFNYAGFRLGLDLDCVYCLPEDDWDNEYYHFENISPNLGVKIPGYVPLELQAYLFPADCYFGYLAGQAILFSWEIQESPGIFSFLYLNRFMLSTQYVAKFKQRTTMESWPITRMDEYIDDFKDGLIDYYDKLSFIGTIYFTLNQGGLARPDFMLKTSFGYHYRFCPEASEDTSDFSFSIGLENFNLF